MRFYFQGGLGNQLFQLAALGYMSTAHRRIKIDLSLIEYSNDATTRREFQLRELVNDYDIVSSQYGKLLAGKPFSLAAKLNLAYSESKGGDWTSLDRGALRFFATGYFQDPRLVTQMADWLSGRFAVAPSWTELASGPQTRRICIHYRLGDYDTIEENRRHFGVLPVEYFCRAVSNVRSSTGIDDIVIVSDDGELAWTRLSEHLSHDVRSIAAISGHDPLHDLKVMAESSHVITSNSSFSWWGGWFSSRRGGSVIAPVPWFLSGRSLLPGVPTWIQLRR